MNGLRWAFPVLIVLACSACSDKTQLPHGILSRDRMAGLVWDMSQADQYASLYLVKDSARIDLKAETLRLYEEVFRLHHTTREEFTKSYRYYLEHPDLDQVLFDSAMAYGARARTEMYDRPFYHSPVLPAVKPVTPAMRPGTHITRPPTVISGNPAGALSPVFHVAPRNAAGLTPEEMRQAHEAAMRRSQDSMARALLRGRTDTTKRH